MFGGGDWDYTGERGDIKCRDYDWEKESRYIVCLRWFRQLQRRDDGYIGQKMLKMK